MNKFEGFINSLNDWREKLMNEERKRDLQAVLQAGKKVIAKLKNYRDSKIVAYDGADCYFTDDEPDIYSDGFEITPEGFTDTEAVNKEKAKGKIHDFVSGITGRKEKPVDDFAEETEEDAAQAEKAFDYYEKIISKIDGLRENIKGNEAIGEIITKAENLFKSGTLSKEQLQAEIDSLMVELDDKLTVILEKTGGVAESVEGLKAQSKDNFENLSSSIGNVSDKAEEMICTLERVDAILRASEPKVGEIHEAALGINKLMDSVFELKNSSVLVKQEIEQIKKKQKFIKIWGIIVGSVVGAVAITSLVFQIINMFI